MTPCTDASARPGQTGSLFKSMVAPMIDLLACAASAASLSACSAK